VRECIQDFYHDDVACAEVDLVLSTVELINFIVSSRTSLAPGYQPGVDTAPVNSGTDSAADGHVNASIVSAEVRDLLCGILHSVRSSRPLDALRGEDDVEALFRHASEDGLTVVSASDSNGSSGGYLEYIYRYAAQVLFNDNIWNEPIEYVIGRNEDFAELSVRGGEGRPSQKLKFARAYGFRNIQSVMMKMKAKRCSYDFVEIMACPKGCANGGGQPKAQERETPSAMRDRVLAVVGRMGEVVVASPDESPLVQWVYGLDRHARDQPHSIPRSVLHTRYHAVPKLEELTPLATANKW
jgi:iron only hydrogenase large subunit-like protein